jgi:hypothetical protein
MPKFALIYRGGNPPSSPEEGQAHMTNWRAWSAGLGAAMTYPGMPFSAALTVSSNSVADGSGDIPMSGISVVEAEDLEAAQAMAKSCPHLNLGGDIVVAQGMDMEM